MKRSILLSVAAAIWLFLWATDTGVLVASFADAEYPGQRVCRYLIGLSAISRYEAPTYYVPTAERCPLLKHL